MTECELITKTLTEAYDFVMKQEDSEEKNELIINLFKSKLLIKNCTISAVSEQLPKCSRCGMPASSIAPPLCALDDCIGKGN